MVVRSASLLLPAPALKPVPCSRFSSGPLFQRRKVTAQAPAGLRRVQTSAASDHSSLSGGIYGNNDMTRSSSARRKVVSVEEKAMVTCCKHKVRRSGFQAYGTIISLARICAYALAIGGMWRWPQPQATVLLGISVLYLMYLRLVVPYSRRDEMALEYFNAVLDIALFGIILALSLTSEENSVPTIDALGIGLLVVQCMGFGSYLVNRMLIIVHAFAEVVCPGCTCNGTPSPRKSRRSRSGRSRSGISRSESLSLSMSDGMMSMQGGYPVDGKGYYVQDGMVVGPDGKADIESGSGSDPQRSDGSGTTGGNGAYVAPNQQQVLYQGAPGPAAPSPARSARAGNPGMFPAIAEETDSQVSSPVVRLGVGVPNGSAGPTNMPVQPTPAAGGSSAKEGGGPAVVPSSVQFPASRPLEEEEHSGTHAVFDKFWKSL